MIPSFAIDHVQIAIPFGGETKGRRFYGELLGLIEIVKPADVAQRGGCWFGIGNQQLHLGIDFDFKPAKKAHVALITQNLEALRRRLEDAGCVVSDDSVDIPRFFSEDPFGNRIEFMGLQMHSDELYLLLAGCTILVGLHGYYHARHYWEGLPPILDAFVSMAGFLGIIGAFVFAGRFGSVYGHPYAARVLAVAVTLVVFRAVRTWIGKEQVRYRKLKMRDKPNDYSKAQL